MCTRQCEKNDKENCQDDGVTKSRRIWRIWTQQKGNKRRMDVLNSKNSKCRKEVCKSSLPVQEHDGRFASWSQSTASMRATRPCQS